MHIDRPLPPLLSHLTMNTRIHQASSGSAKSAHSWKLRKVRGSADLLRRSAAAAVKEEEEMLVLVVEEEKGG